MAEKKKASRNYNVESMTFDLLGKTHTLTAVVDALKDSEKLAMLIGASNMAVDSVASLTKKDGFTTNQRQTKIAETVAAINDGTYKTTRAPRETVAKAVANMAFIVIKFAKKAFDEISVEEAEIMKKYDIDLYKDWLEYVTDEPDEPEDEEEESEEE